MSVRRLILLLGAVLLIAGGIGLFVPVSVSGSDGDSVGCGNAVAANLSEARDADDSSGANIPVLSEFIPHTDYVAHCQSSLSTRRGWSIPLAAVGAVAIAGAALVRRPSASGVAPSPGDAE